MMRKTVTYIVTAVLLGVATMTFPRMLLTSEKVVPSDTWGGHLALKPCDVENLRQSEKIGVIICPSGPLHIGLILAFSFVLALGVCLYFKRRMF